MTLAQETPSQSSAVNIAPLLNQLVPALRRLDTLLEHLLGEIQAAGGVAQSALRGLYVSAQEAAQLLRRAPGAPAIVVPMRFHGSLCGSSRLEILQRWFGLSPLELDMVLIALAPELDLRYERLFGYLQDDTSRRRATVDLALNLRAASAEDKIARLSHFNTDAPLVRHSILHLVPDANQAHPPLLAHYLKPDPQIVAALLGDQSVDRRLLAFCHQVDPTQVPRDTLSNPYQRALLTFGRRVSMHVSSEPAIGSAGLTFEFSGPAGSGRFAAACALAANAGLTVLRADLGQAAWTANEARTILPVLVREAWLKRSLLYVAGFEALRSEEGASLRDMLLAMLRQHPGVAVLATGLDGRQDHQSHQGHLSLPGQHCSEDDSAPIHVVFVAPDSSVRANCWRRSLERRSITLAESEIETLANRFRLTPVQIGRAVSSACNHACWRTAADEGRGSQIPELRDLFAAAREQSSADFAGLARKIVPKQGWADVVLPADPMAQLHEICDCVHLRRKVYEEWRFGRRMSAGKGLSVLFTGPPGTGKTLAAEVIAGELGLELHRIDLSQVVSKYIGETEKGLDRLFTAAENANAILFFDEADSLFGKRSEVKDAHDRYANIEIGYLLQKMEEYEGVAILATNLRQNLDDAFVRRIQFIVEFPFPDADQRRRIWEVTFSREAPLASDVDFEILAREITLAGGNIRNIALAASFRAAKDGGPIRMEHIIQASRREHHKIGRMWDLNLSPFALQTGSDGTDDQ